MSSIAITLIVFACVFGGAMLGVFLRSTLPDQHRSAESKETVKLAMGLVATMSALVLGLLVSSAKGFYDTQSTELTEMSAKAVLLDRVLAPLWAGGQGNARSAARRRCQQSRSNLAAGTHTNFRSGTSDRH